MRKTLVVSLAINAATIGWLLSSCDPHPPLGADAGTLISAGSGCPDAIAMPAPDAEDDFNIDPTNGRGLYP